MSHEHRHARRSERRPPAVAAAAQAFGQDDARFRALIRHSTDIITIHRADSTTVYETPSASRILGHPPGMLIGRSPFDSIHPKDAGAAREAFHAVLTGKGAAFPVEFRFRRADGSWIHLEAIGSNHLDDPGIRGIVLTSRDISARKAAERHIRYLANHDMVTGLPNRVLLEDRLRHALAQARLSGRQAALVLVDLDQFQLVNSMAGHPGGDHLLRETAARIGRELREADTLARFGNDEFAIVLPVVPGADDVASTTRRILAAVAAPLSIGPDALYPSASAGISLYPTDGACAEDLLRRADTALHGAKLRGKGHCEFYTAALNERARARVAIETGLRAALADDGFELHYQPKVSVATGLASGTEALLRWRQPGSDLLAPGSFIPVAEETGLIHDIGAWVIETACARAAAWRSQGLAVGVAVNLSPCQFRRPGLADMVLAQMEHHGLPAGSLEVEITEGVVMDPGADAVAILSRLRRHGVRVSIDDFGTGYSSLAYLHRFPVDSLKIDQSFVRDMTADSGSAAIVRAIVALARSLGMSVTAEGVETPAQLAMLRESGCDHAQGNLFSRPLPAGEATHWLGASLLAAP